MMTPKEIERGSLKEQNPSKGFHLSETEQQKETAIEIELILFVISISCYFKLVYVLFRT